MGITPLLIWAPQQPSSKRVCFFLRPGIRRTALGAYLVVENSAFSVFFGQFDAPQPVGATRRPKPRPTVDTEILFGKMSQFGTRTKYWVVGDPFAGKNRLGFARLQAYNESGHPGGNRDRLQLAEAKVALEGIQGPGSQAVRKRWQSQN